MMGTKPLTKSQLKEVVAQYAAQFPDWAIFPNGAAFTRSFGPIQQMIWFQALRTGEYRPTHVINSTILSMPRMLDQLPDVRNRESSLSQHETRMPKIIAAMEAQFKPDIRKPLDIAEVLALCEAEAESMPDTTNNMTMLAILSAWLGRDGDALGYCERLHNSPLPKLAPMPEWEDAMRAFGSELTNAVRAGKAREFLEGVQGEMAR